ncbi:sugar transporter [Spirosoma terrae]|uniref:Sugar transporter n=1 Tax=Spirosoma terrae TaxID=1968276 RepID=A0A6L9LIN2_9BACT|nr:sugar transporter [Spirosoma terrae]
MTFFARNAGHCYCFALICVLGWYGALAQSVDTISDEQVKQFVQQAKASGLTETQIEQLAKSKGYTEADIARLRQRINQLIGDARTELSAGASDRKQQAAETDVVRQQPATLSTPLDQTVTSAVFGASLFSTSNLTFEPNLRIPTPRNYLLGPEDELVIEVYGHAQQTYRPKVSPEGSIHIENLGPIYVNGLTIEQAQQRIVGRLRTLYQGLNSAGSGIQAQITLGSIRSMKVTLIGQVVRPGTYTLSSLASVFNALYVAGGPSPERGSFRDIRVYRNNRLVRTLDIYDFLLRADQKDNIRLHDQDIVFVDHYHTRIELNGEVKQPGIYETKAGETLQTILNFAGGYTDRAYTATVALRRNTATARRYVTINASELAGFIPQSGDTYEIGTILDRFDNKVTINGAVFRPGDFALESCATLKQLLKRAEGLREDAFLNRATIRRLRSDLNPEMIDVDLNKLIRNEIPDIALQRDDIVTISAISELREQRTVSIQGAVNKVGTFPFADSMTVASLIVLAGGFTEGAISSRIEIARRITGNTTDLPDGQTTRILSFSVDRHLRLEPADATLLLEPFDQVFVRSSPRYEPQKGVIIRGEVNYPGSYAIRTATDRITDLITRSGGLKADAYLPAARFKRKTEAISVDMQKVLLNPADLGNLLLQDGDTLTIPRRVDLVRIRGEVLNPATVEYNPTKSFRAYLDEAGGFTNKALRRKTYAIAANGKIRPAKSWLGFVRYPRPERDMDIIVPATPSREQPKLSATERAALFSVIASGAAVVLAVLRTFTN